MFIDLAWKNIFHQPRRSLVTVLLLLTATAILIFAGAFMEGSHQQMIRSAVEIYPGYLQITGVGYQDEPGVDRLIFDLAAVNHVLEEMADVAVFSSRYESFVLLASDHQALGALLVGIEPAREAQLSRLQQSLIRGQYLSDDDQNQIYLGRELAEKLKVDVGSSLAFVGSGVDASFAADRLQVKGIFQTGLFGFDSSSCFVNRAYLEPLMALANTASHVIVLPRHLEKTRELTALINRHLPPDLEAQSWQQTMAGLVEAMAVDSIFGYLTLGVLFLVILFVITIYTLLAIMARTREIGILRAIGSSQGQIFTLLFLEGIILTLTGVLPGGLLGGAFAWYFQENPISMNAWDEQFKQYNLAVSALPALFSWAQILRDMVIMTLMALTAMLIPLFRVTRLRPTEAMRHV